MVATVIEVVVHTGYPADFVELDQDLEGELGIDTVKQKAIMADIGRSLVCPWTKISSSQTLSLRSIT